jgi:hypothetical protein
MTTFLTLIIAATLGPTDPDGTTRFCHDPSDADIEHHELCAEGERCLSFGAYGAVCVPRAYYDAVVGEAR